MHRGKIRATLSIKAFRETVSLHSPPASCAPLPSGFPWRRSLLVTIRNSTGKEILMVLRTPFLPDPYHPLVVIILDDIGSPLHSTFRNVLTSVPATTPHLSDERILATEAALHTVPQSDEEATAKTVEVGNSLVLFPQTEHASWLY